MAFSAAVSTASFSVILAETFAALGAATIVPTTFVAGLKSAKGAGTSGGSSGGSGSSTSSTGLQMLDKIGGFGEGLKPVFDTLKSGLANIDEVPILLPRDAKLHAEFEFEGHDKVEGGVSVGAQIQVVTVAAGYSLLYESRSRNKITLDMNFVSVNVKL